MVAGENSGCSHEVRPLYSSRAQRIDRTVIVPRVGHVEVNGGRAEQLTVGLGFLHITEMPVYSKALDLLNSGGGPYETGDVFRADLACQSPDDAVARS